MTTLYLQRLANLRQQLEKMGSPAKLDLPFHNGRPPTQAFSEFLTNKEQGDWAERTFIDNFNRLTSPLWAVKYGRSEDLIAGDVGFADYYSGYQQELAEIGKRPDLLLFDRRAFNARFGETCNDISTLPRDELDVWVPQAQLAIEVRSSAFISKKYYDAVTTTRSEYIKRLRTCAQELISAYRLELLKYSPEWLDFATTIMSSEDSFNVAAPRAFSRRSTENLQTVSELSRQIKENLKLLSQRDFLSITPKAEDLTLVYRWIQRYQVPHYYCQVFFDRAVIISFEQILAILCDPDRENIDYYIEEDEKNQRKTTFKINIRLGQKAMSDISLPVHRSAMKELPKGRLLFYVRFDPSVAQVSTEGWCHV